MADVASSDPSSGSITILWEHFGGDERDFRWSMKTEPPCLPAELPRITALLRLITEMHEAELELDRNGWPEES